jgi:hypothetical protein
MNPDGRNNRVRRHLSVISQNGVDLGQNFIDRFNGLAGRPFVVAIRRNLSALTRLSLVSRIRRFQSSANDPGTGVGAGNDKSLPALFRSAMNIPLALRRKKRP